MGNVSRRCVALADQLQKDIEQHGWDGQWYRRAYFDDGEPLGSQSNVERQIDALPQSWSVISGAGERSHARLAMASVYQRLVRRDVGLIQLFDPPFDKTRLDPGYIKGYIPGVRELEIHRAASWTSSRRETQSDDARNHKRNRTTTAGHWGFHATSRMEAPKSRRTSLKSDHKGCNAVTPLEHQERDRSFSESLQPDFFWEFGFHNRPHLRRTTSSRERVKTLPRSVWRHLDESRLRLGSEMVGKAFQKDLRPAKSNTRLGAGASCSNSA